MITMTTARALGQATKWQVSDVHPIDNTSEASVTVQLLNSASIIISEKTLVIRNGNSDRCDYNTNPIAGQRMADALLFTQYGLSTPTGYDDAVAVWRAASTPAARRAALEAHMLTVGYMGSTLAGS